MKDVFLLACCVALLGSTVTAQTPEGTKKFRTVRVRGTGSVSTVPDQIRLNMQVSVRGESASSAMQTAGARTKAVIELLRSHGVADKEIRTMRITVSPVYDREKRTQQPYPIVGYVAGNDIVVLFKDDAVKQLGDFLDKAVSEGASNFGSLMYESSKEKDLESEALAEAALDARARAAQIARVLGASVGRVISVNESGMTTPPPISYDQRVVSYSETAAPVMTGEMEVTASVDVEFELLENEQR